DSLDWPMLRGISHFCVAHPRGARRWSSGSRSEPGPAKGPPREGRSRRSRRASRNRFGTLRMAGLAGLPLRSWLAGALLLKRSAEQGLDYGLPADVEPGRPPVEFPQKAFGEVDIYTPRR